MSEKLLEHEAFANGIAVGIGLDSLLIFKEWKIMVIYLGRIL